MSTENGKPNGRILSLDTPTKSRPLGKGSDFITVQQCAEIMAVETSKVHEYYLTQIPAFTARMIQDALMSYGLITMTDEATQALGRSRKTRAETRRLPTASRRKTFPTAVAKWPMFARTPPHEVPRMRSRGR